MLNTKTLKRLIVITAICAIPVVIIAINAGNSVIKNKDSVFLPNLLKGQDQISKVIVQEHDQTFTFNKSESGWQLQERNNYPVLADRVEHLIYSLADLRIVEPKTANKEYYSQIDVNDVTEANSNAVLLTLHDKTGENITQLYVGKREGVRLGEDYQEHIFVRRANEAQTWLVQGVLPITSDFKDWVDQPLLGVVDTDQIQRIEFNRPQGDKLVIAKSMQDQEDFVLETAQPKKGMTLDLDSVNSVPFEVAELEFEDVMPANSNIDWKNGLVAQLKTFIGMQVSLDVVKQGTDVFARAHAVAAPDASPEVQEKVAAYNNAKGPWIFKLPKEFYNTLSLRNTDFLKAAE